MRKLSLIALVFSITTVLQAQSNATYTVNNYSPFTILKNGSKIDPPRSQKTTKEKTTFIALDCRLNIYSYTEIPSIGINIYKNGELIKKFPMKVSGLIVLNADSIGNWAGYIKTGKGVASIYTNGKFAKTVKIDETVSEKIVGVENNGDVISLVTDKIKSQLVLKKNGSVISSKKLPKLNGRAEAMRVIEKDVHVSGYTIAYLSVPTVEREDGSQICKDGGSYDLLCMESRGCIMPDGSIDLRCAEEAVRTGACPCTEPRAGTNTVPTNGSGDDGSSSYTYFNRLFNILPCR